MYEKQLQALHKSGRYRSRDVFNSTYLDLGSNDYLGMAANKKTLRQACTIMQNLDYHGPKASQLVNGYHPIHEEFERTLCFKNGFEKGLLAGSGFLANLALIADLGRKGDTLYIDEQYHASGILATKLTHARVIFFAHNDPDDLSRKLQAHRFGRALIAIEGVYSMQGDVAAKEIFTLAEDYDALLIVDEAHSSGVIGPNLLGVFDHYGITPKANHIKMGTLGKAYGSYGAYILGCSEVIEFLQNRAKSVIYATAPPLFDTLLGYLNFNYIYKKRKKLAKKRDKRLNYFQSQSLIIPFVCQNNRQTITLQQTLKENGVFVGAIRQPTVKVPIIRLIAKLDVKMKKTKEVVKTINDSISS
ncbi:MAG: aminotransferase class I/II-fold pyridoxal phosphate-dependent enzyme [Campylobacterota bacterium]